MVIRHPVTTPDDVEKLRVTNVKTAGSIPIMFRFGQLCLQHAMPVTFQVGTPLTMAGGIIGEPLMLRWMIKEPTLVHKVLRKVTDFCIAVAEYFATEFGAEHLMAFDAGPTEANQLISPKQFEEYVLPYIIEIHEKLINLGIPIIFTHICGEQNLNLKHWQKVPMGKAGIVSFGAEVDINKAIELFGDNAIIAGNLDPTIIQTNTPEDVYESLSK